VELAKLTAGGGARSLYEGDTGKPTVPYQSRRSVFCSDSPQLLHLASIKQGTKMSDAVKKPTRVELAKLAAGGRARSLDEGGTGKHTKRNKGYSN